jgi:hypothetical protein
MRVNSQKRDPRVVATSHNRRYRIRVRGVLSETLLCAFPGLDAETHSGDTVLAGALSDQAALYGVLDEIEALGLELLEVSQISP